MQIRKQPWGMENGQQVYLFEMDNGSICARVSNYGGVLQSLLVKNACGETLDVVLGYDTLQEYIDSDTFFGALVGPIADRLAEGKCVLGGKTVRFPLNAGPDSMHSSDFGFHCRVWNWEILTNGVALNGCFAPGEAGLPGRLDVRVCYRLIGNALRMEYSASSDCESALSFTNHSYFTLNGGKDHCRDHVLHLFADHYAETCRENDPICTGRTIAVEGTPMDMRTGCRVGDILACNDFPEIRTGGGIDHYFPLAGKGLRSHAELFCGESRLKMICRSTAPGVLVYSANGLEAEKGKDGNVYGRNWAVCLEAESFPNAVNLPGRRDGVILRPGEVYSAATEYVFECC